MRKAHPNWTMSQLMTIIRLQWKQEKMKRNSNKNERVSRRIARTGYQALRMSRDLSSSEAKEMWRRLPRESKINWSKRSS